MEKDLNDALNELDHGMNMMANHVNAMTNRVIHAEMALDVFLGIMFEDEDLKKTFEEKFAERMKEVQEARQVAIQKAQEEEINKEEESNIITPFEK